MSNEPNVTGKAEVDPIEAAFADPAPTLPTPAEKLLKLTATNGPHQGQVFNLAGHQVFLVGRSAEAHLQLSAEDRSASRNHFLIEFNPPNCRLTDLGSRTGTFVNGERVLSAELRDGDAIRAGRTTLAVVLAAVNPVAPSAADMTEAPADERPTNDLYRTVGTAKVPGPRPLPLPSDLPRIAGYHLERELGRGGMGIVYLATRATDGSRVALKTIRPVVADNPALVQRFLREADILRQLDHDNIVRFRESGQCDGLVYFGMDYVEGIDAARLLQQNGRPLSVPVAVRTMCKVLKALAYAHDKGFVHRDLKPANVLIAGSGPKKVVKLADFGLARAYQESRLSGLTMQGDVGGTVAYLPPEQITQFRQVQPAADQYAAAATLYHLLTGLAIYDPPATTNDWFKLILETDPVPIQSRRPDLPAGLAGAIHRALARNPADRFVAVHAFHKALIPFQ